MKYPNNSIGNRTATFRLVVQCYFSLYRLNLEYKFNNQLGTTIYVCIYACVCVCVAAKSKP